jgi:hypothetical protein
MKWLGLFSFLFVIPAFGQTVIYYEDGTAYTLKDNEYVYVSQARKMYQKKDYTNGNVYFTHKKPNSQVDPQASPTDGMEPGSDEWCDVYVPYQYGYTFDDQIWQRYCQD